VSGDNLRELKVQDRSKEVENTYACSERQVLAFSVTASAPNREAVLAAAWCGVEDGKE
jgi:hypothetical protein